MAELRLDFGCGANHLDGQIYSNFIKEVEMILIAGVGCVIDEVRNAPCLKMLGFVPQPNLLDKRVLILTKAY
ncbi:hypothetical protein G7B40_017455 [Aetokthonos hydrillicola Thurmond2011]|jgi:hypothetical protein|uniref:Uncharacterized protein n=1 Tax=Aetokthonos hydrillicola Thurmond2011 TaxID=2712845 RepID=A0AAP5M8J9_9CYAN|nr:hypothetical protein [Aetokthonos hydrillicola CCALA 1050]MBW4584369.1 hypothetical protein [Aetokthonos hydrillicola CCALA 1050]MDR9896330.1 hypothetical protein [Aetokthonos hydrillicola Thurmond2011]